MHIEPQVTNAPSGSTNIALISVVVVVMVVAVVLAVMLFIVSFLLYQNKGMGFRLYTV